MTNSQNGVVVKGMGGLYYVKTPCKLFECNARGSVKQQGMSLTVGDKVCITVNDSEKCKAVITKIYPRRTELIRPRVANIDNIVIVFSIVMPDLNLDMLDRFIILAEERRLNIIVCINKSDLAEISAARLITDRYAAIGYDSNIVSIVTKMGIEDLKLKLGGGISAFAGPSGAGKSSLINAVCNVNFRTGGLSAKIMRGKHTTRHAELIEFLPDSFVIDTPGFTSLSLEHIPKEDLKNYFIEFGRYEEDCRFKGCNHLSEPGCAVKPRVGTDINQARYERYMTIFEELRQVKKKYDN